MSRRPVYVGKLLAVRVGPDDVRQVRPVALGVVEGRGLVTSRNRDGLEAGRLHREPSGVAWPCEAVYYERARREGSSWVHDTPGAWVVFRRIGRSPLPFAWLDSSASYRCTGPGDFICER